MYVLFYSGPETADIMALCVKVTGLNLIFLSRPSALGLTKNYVGEEHNITIVSVSWAIRYGH
jgi:hypothetical protein